MYIPWIARFQEDFFVKRGRWRRFAVTFFDHFIFNLIILIFPDFKNQGAEDKSKAIIAERRGKGEQGFLDKRRPGVIIGNWSIQPSKFVGSANFLAKSALLGRGRRKESCSLRKFRTKGIGYAVGSFERRVSPSNHPYISRSLRGNC